MPIRVHVPNLMISMHGNPTTARAIVKHYDDSLSGSTDALATDRVREARAYKTALTSRIFAHSIFSEYKGLLIDWKLADFTHRWDLCLRWLWESSYLDHVNKLANKYF